MKKNMKVSFKKDFLILVDVGASGGLDERWSKFNNLKTILFEPDIEEFNKLLNNKLENSIVINSALADEPRIVNFHICNWQQVSSIFEPNKELLAEFEDSERFNIQKTVSLKADSLNNLLKAKNIHEIDFIKIDTQGSELDILKGASNYFPSLIGLEVEVEFIQLYLNQPLFNEINNFVESNGFILMDLRRSYWKRKGHSNSSKKGQLICGDALYFRHPQNLFTMQNLTQEKIFKSVQLYLTYGYDDFASMTLQLAENKRILTKVMRADIIKLIKNSKAQYVLPNFRGKGRIKNLLNFFANKFSSKNFHSGTDENLGNY